MGDQTARWVLRPSAPVPVAAIDINTLSFGQLAPQ